MSGRWRSVQDELDRFPDGFQRLLLWHTLWDMVRDQQFSAADYAALATDKLASERTLEIAQTVAYNALQAVGSYLPDELRLESASGLYRFAREQLLSTTEQDFRIMWSRVMIGAAQSVEHIGEALSLVDEGTGIDGFELDQDMRWSLVTKATAYGVEGGYERLDAELERDGSDRGRRAAEQIRTSASRRVGQGRSVDSLPGGHRGVAADADGVDARFWWKPQAELLDGYVDRFFDEVRSVFDRRDKEYASRFFGAMYPGQMAPSDQVIDRSEALLEELGDELVVLSRPLREALDEARRARACREFAASQARS